MNHQPSLRTKKSAPVCPVFEECQGCSFQDIDYSDELKIKEAQIKELLCASVPVNASALHEITPSPKCYHYRNRLDLKLKRTRENGVLIGFTPVNRRGVLPVEACFIAEKNISDFIPTLKKEALLRLPAKYRVANLVVRTGKDGRVLWGGIGKRSCALQLNDYLWTVIDGKKIFYSLDTFFQANLAILPDVFRAIKSLALWDNKPVFYDLYGGVGLFAVGLAEKAGHVYLIEENPASVKAARHNIAANELDNVRVIAGKVEDELPRLMDTKSGKNNVAMIDPPRGGLSAKASSVIAATKTFNHILYLSCNPESLARDLKVFQKEGWKIEHIYPFDFFPRTKHIETLVVLTV